MPINSEKLKAEINDDPAGLGYSGRSDHQVAALMSEPGLNGQKVEREFVTAAEIHSGLLETEWEALGQSDKDWYELLVASGGLYTGDTARTRFEEVFPAGTQTNANFHAVLKRPASRAEKANVGARNVHHRDVARARRA